MHNGGHIIGGARPDHFGRDLVNALGVSARWPHFARADWHFKRVSQRLHHVRKRHSSGPAQFAFGHNGLVFSNGDVCSTACALKCAFIACSGWSGWSAAFCLRFGLDVLRAFGGDLFSYGLRNIPVDGKYILSDCRVSFSRLGNCNGVFARFRINVPQLGNHFGDVAEASRSVKATHKNGCVNKFVWFWQPAFYSCGGGGHGGCFGCQACRSLHASRSTKHCGPTASNNTRAARQTTYDRTFCGRTEDSARPAQKFF